MGKAHKFYFLHAFKTELQNSKTYRLFKIKAKRNINFQNGNEAIFNYLYSWIYKTFYVITKLHAFIGFSI